MGDRLVLGWFSERFARRALVQARGGPAWLWWLHVLGAMGWMVCVSGRTTYVEAGGALLWLMTLVRLPWVWRAVVLGLGHPLFLALVGWTAVRAVSLAWSADVVAGLDRIDKMRFVWNIPFLLPLASMVGPLAVGVVVGSLWYNLGQVSHALSRAGVSWLPQWDRMPNRNSGWNEPVAGGTNLCAVLGLHLGAMLVGLRSRRRGWMLLGGIGAVVTVAGVVATGTRGAWIASAGLLALACVVGLLVLRRRWGWSGRRVALAGVLAAVLVGVAAVAAWPVAKPRAMEARRELEQAFVQRDFSSYTGTRLLLMWWAVQAFAEHPVLGVGEGGYEPWVLENLRRRGIDPTDRTHTGPHPHNTLLQPLASTGLVGLGVYALVLVVMARVAWSARLHRHPYASAVPWALLGLFLAGMFEVVHLNTHVLAMWHLLMGLAVAASVDAAVGQGAGSSRAGVGQSAPG